MSGWDGPYPPRSRPRKVEGGIKARTARGTIGRSWWSRRFLQVLESFALGTRLTRGRSYARAGQVLSLEVAPGRITASVQGSRARPYRVTIGFEPFPALVWAKVEVILAEQAIYSARLLAGDMPPDIEQVFADAGAPLFPERLRDLTMSCSCPDFAVPCKHLAATFYLLAEAFDTDPFQILQWRGRDRASLLSRLRELRGSAPAGGEPADAEAAGGEPASAKAAGSKAARSKAARGKAAGAKAARGRPAESKQATPAGQGTAEAVVGAGLALAEVTSPPLADTQDRFWLPPVPLPHRPPTLAAEPDLLLRQLPPPGPALGGPALVERLHTAYQRLASRPDE